jgi:hypothetical protein
LRHSESHYIERYAPSQSLALRSTRRYKAGSRAWSVTARRPR